MSSFLLLSFSEIFTTFVLYPTKDISIIVPALTLFQTEAAVVIGIGHCFFVLGEYYSRAGYGFFRFFVENGAAYGK